MENIHPEQSLSNDDLIDILSKIIGDRDVSPDTLADKCKIIKDWNLLLEHQKLLRNSLRREISLQTTVLDYILSAQYKQHDSRAINISISKKVSYSSIIDQVTGLYNDKHFQLLIDAALKRVKTFGMPLAVIFLDLDNFSMYTTMFGQEAGDIALSETAIILRKYCRKEDLIFRIRKNRFAIILLSIPKESAHTLGERLRANVAEYHFKGEDKIPPKKITISGGIALFPDDGKNSNTLMLAAEEALNTAKQSGKNRVLEYSMKRRQSPRVRLNVEAKYQIDGRKDIKPFTVNAKNISESGLLLNTHQELPLGGVIVLTLKLPTGNSIKLKGLAVRISKRESDKETNIAVKFIDVSPVDSMALKLFVEKELSKPQKDGN